MSGEQLKLHGMSKVSANNAAWMQRAITVIRVLTPETITSDDLRAFMKSDQPRHPNAWGAAFKRAAEQGIIQPDGFAKSKRPVGHGRMVRRWRHC